MKVKYLIEKLQQLDEDTEIVISDGDLDSGDLDRHIILEDVELLIENEDTAYLKNTSFGGCLKNRAKTWKEVKGVLIS